MTMNAETKTGIVQSHRLHDKDTGSADVQVALLTSRILEVAGHLKGNVKDHAARRGLLKMVSRRSSLLKYLTRTDRTRYKSLISDLGLRK